MNLKLKGLATCRSNIMRLNSFDKRCITFDFPREREQEIIKALDSIGIEIEVRNYGR